MKNVIQIGEEFLDKLIFKRRCFADKFKEKGEISFSNSFNNINIKEIKFETYKNSIKKEIDFEEEDKDTKCYIRFITNYYDEFGDEIIYNFEVNIKKGMIHLNYLGGSPTKMIYYKFDEIILPYLDLDFYFMDEIFELFSKNEEHEHDKELEDIIKIFIDKIKPFIQHLLEIDNGK